jgi:hypothetical protein
MYAGVPMMAPPVGALMVMVGDELGEPVTALPSALA